MHIFVHTKPQCQPCKFTKRKLDQLDIDYTEVPLEDPEYFKQMELFSAPVVEVDLGEGAFWRWSGHAPSQLEVLDHVFGCDDPECPRCEGLIAA